MGKRSTGRRLAMQALYEAEFGSSEIDDAFNNLLEIEKPGKEPLEFARKLASQTLKNKTEIDGIIKRYAKDWSLERIGGVDRNILRLALFELMEGETPPQVIINEAIELAKKYSSSDAAKFINGILGGYVKTLKAGRSAID